MNKRYRIAIPVGAAIVVAGVLLGIFLTGEPDPEPVEFELAAAVAEPATDPPPDKPETAEAATEPKTGPSAAGESLAESETAAAEPAADPAGTGEPPLPSTQPPAATGPVDSGSVAPPADSAAGEQEPAAAGADATAQEFAPETTAEPSEPMDAAAVDTRDTPPAEPAHLVPADEVPAAQPASSDRLVAASDEPSRPAPAAETAAAPNAAAETAPADQAAPGEAPSGPAPERSPAVEPARAAAEGTVETVAAEDPAAGETAESAPIPPSFDVVRINPQGRAVIAGRAEPGATVTVRDGTREIGSVTADRRGEWALVPDRPLAGGEHALSAIETLPDGRQVESEGVVVVSVPGRGDAPAEALAVLVPRDGKGPSRVLQRPGQTAPDRTGESGAAIEPGSERASRTPAADGAPDSGSAAAPDQGIRDEEDGTLVVESVDYDEEGDVVIAGKAEPGAAVNVYVDDRHVGTVETGDEGSWEIEPGDRIEPGAHTLRIDRVDSAGIVLARIETPLVRASLEELSFSDAIVVVQPGNSLWRIARRTLGGGVHFTVIYQANRGQIRDPALIYPGQIFTVPRLN